jgi:hypothetical protein
VGSYGKQQGYGHPVLTNDLPNAENKAKSAEELKKLGLDKAIKSYNRIYEQLI